MRKCTPLTVWSGADPAWKSFWLASIVLKDNAILPDEDLDTSPVTPSERTEPVIDLYPPAPIFSDADDSDISEVDDSDDLEEESNESETSQSADNAFSENLSKENIDDILDDIDSALDDTFFDDFNNDLNTVSNDDFESEQIEESEADTVSDEPEQGPAETQEEDSPLVFSPWDELVTIEEDSTEHEEKEHDSWKETGQSINEDSESDGAEESEEPLFIPWQEETVIPESDDDFLINDIEGDELSTNDSTDKEIADNEIVDTETVENDNHDFQQEPDDTKTPEIPEQANRTNFGESLNPFAYSIQQISIDHILPPLIPVDTDDVDSEVDSDVESGIESEIKSEIDTADTNPETESFDEYDLDTFTSDETEQSATIESVFLGTTTESEIPTLVPDLVATETIPASMNTRALAWFQSLKNSLTGQEESESNNTRSDNKAMIHSHLANLNDEDSLEPMPGEKLDAIDEAPVELLNMSDKMKHWKSAGMVLGCLVLLSALGSQYLIYNLDTLAQDNRFNAVTSLVCQVVECSDNTEIDLSNLITEELVVRSHPSADNALMVDFIFRNESSSEQLFPMAELNFTNIGGEIIANRVFDRSEYLPQEMQLFTHMPAHSSIQVSLELMDPGDDATGYALVFRNP